MNRAGHARWGWGCGLGRGRRGRHRRVTGVKLAVLRSVRLTVRKLTFTERNKQPRTFQNANRHSPQVGTRDAAGLGRGGCEGRTRGRRQPSPGEDARPPNRAEACDFLPSARTAAIWAWFLLRRDSSRGVARSSVERGAGSGERGTCPPFCRGRLHTVCCCTEAPAPTPRASKHRAGCGVTGP